MKKKFYGLFLMLFMFCLSIGLSACGDINPPKTENKEFEEYESIVTSVVENCIDKLGDKQTEKTKSSPVVGDVKPLAVTSAIKDQIFEVAEKYSDKELIDNTSLYRDVYEQTFFIPLVCGDAITEYYKADKFYGVSVAIFEQKQFITTESVGDSKISYCYSSPGSVFNEEMFILMIVDYKGDTDFTFQALQFNADYSNIFFAYGDSSLEFLNIGKNENQSWITYNKSDGVAYAISDEDVVNTCYDMIKADFTSVDLEKVRGVGRNPQYSLTEEQYTESSRKYMDGIDPVEGIFDVRDGVVFGWMGDASTCPEELTLPSDATSIYYNFHMPENVRKLTIPANIKNIKIEKLQLEQYENPNMEKPDNPDDPANREMVDCPSKYFDMSRDDSSLEQIIVENGSPLFKIQKDCLYSKDDILLHIPSSVTSLSLDGLKISRGAERCLYVNSFKDLKEVDCTLTYGERQEGSVAKIAFDPFARLMEAASQNGVTYSFDRVIIRGIQDIQEGNGYHIEDYVLNVPCDYSVKKLELYGEGGVEIRSDLKSMTVSEIIVNEGIAGLTANIAAHAEGLSIDVPSSAEWLSIRNSVEDKNSQVNINLPWSKYGIIMNGLYDLLEIRQEDYDPDYNTTTWVRDDKSQYIYHFLELSDEDKESIEGEVSAEEFFKDIVYYNAGENGFDYPTAQIRNYYGSDAVVKVPRIISGYTVTGFYLSNAVISPELGDTNISGVKKVYLPKTLTTFGIGNSYGSQYYVLDKIVYDGTKAKFEEICGGAENVQNMLPFTALIECADGNFIGQEKGDKETYTFEDANKNTIIINVDWAPLPTSGGEGGYNMLISVNYNKEQHKLHMVTHGGGALQFGKTENGSPRYSLEIRTEWIHNSNTLSVYFRDLMIIEEKPEIPFELKSRVKFDGEINIVHDYQRVEISAPTCEYEGLVVTTCAVCNHTQKGTEEVVKPLGHDYVGETVDATCTTQQHKHYECSRCHSQYDGDYTGELAPHVDVEYDRMEASCEIDGYIKLRCCNCGQNEHEEKLLAPGHDFHDVGEAPTCTENGYLQEVCSRCGESGLYEFFPALGHKYDTYDFCHNCHADSKIFKISMGEDGWHILGFKDDMFVEHLVIPDNLGGFSVVEITNYAFEENNLKSVSIPGSIKTIGDYAFSNGRTGNGELMSVTIGSGVKSIGKNVFWGCSRLTSIVIPTSVETIGNGAFSGCNWLTVYAAAERQPSGWGSSWLGLNTEVVWNYNRAYGITDDRVLWVTNEDGSLMISGYCGTETDVILPSQIDGKTVKSIQRTAISNNQSLLGIVIPESITIIPRGGIMNCANLTVYAKADELPNGWEDQWVQYSVFVMWGAGDEHGTLDNGLDWTTTKDNTITIFRYNGEATSIDIPSQINGKAVTRIYKNAFTNRNLIRNIAISSSVISIGKEAFMGCSDIGSVTFGHGSQLTDIGESAFYGCNSLASIDLPEGLKTIGDSAFRSCHLFTSFVVPNSVTTIGYGAFVGCNLESISLPFVGNSLGGTENTHFGYIFGSDNYSQQYNIIPASLKTVNITGGVSIDRNAFYYCPNLTSVILDEGVTSIGDSVFANCGKLTSVELNGVENIGNGVFRDCVSLSGVTLGSKVTSISDYLFEGCRELTSITIGDNVKAIGNGAFLGCVGLTGVTIGGGVETIGNEAFSGCSMLSSVSLGSKMTTIGNNMFENCNGLINIMIPSNVKTIGDGAFLGCIGLISVTIGSGVETIGDRAFSGCELLNNIAIPSNVKTIGGSAFSGCNAFNSIVIPDSVTKIGASAFSLPNLEQITLPFVGSTLDGTENTRFAYVFGVVPNTLKTAEITGGTSIGNSAFYDCTYLENIVIPSSVTSIGDRAFENCSALTSFTLPNKLRRVGSSAFSNCNNLATMNYDGDIASWCGITFENELANPLYFVRKLHINDQLVTEVSVPSSVENVGSFTFAYCSDIVSVLIENGVKTIGEGAFMGTAITNIEIPDSVTALGSGAFACDNLTSATIGKGVRSFGVYVFKAYTLTNLDYTGDIASWCAIDFKSVIENPVVDANSQIKFTVQGNKLTEVIIPSSVTRIGPYAFAGFTFIQTLVIPSSVQSIGEGAFYSCGARSITIPSGVTRIENETFRNCMASSINIPDTVTSIGYYAFKESYVQEIIIPSSVQSIEEYAFADSHSLVKVVISDSVTALGIGAFDRCVNLRDVTIGSGLTEIPAGTFSGCYKISSIIIPSNILSIGGSAFYDCYGLTNITIESGVTNIGGLAFYGCRELTSVEIPRSVISIGRSAFQGCDNLESLTIPFAGEFAGGTGATHIGFIFGAVDYLGNSAAVPSGLKTVVINGESAIGDYAFYGCNGLSTVNMNFNVTNIGNYAFYDCSALTTVVISNSVGSIGDYAFSGCTNIGNLQIGDYVKSIGQYAFSGCANLSTLTLGDSVKEIGEYAFNGCISILQLNIGSDKSSHGTPRSDLAIIGANAFEGCTRLAIIDYMGTIWQWCNVKFGNLQANPLYWGHNLYLQGKLLKNLVIPENITSIGEYTFYNCSSLTSIEIPDSVNTISFGAFKGCSRLVSISLPFLGKNYEGSNQSSHLGFIFGAEEFSENSTYVPSSLGIVKVNNSKFIGEGAFYNCSNLVTVWLTLSVVEIRDSAFENCTDLTVFENTSGVTSIGNKAFKGCKSLPDAPIGRNVISVGDYAFAECDGLTSVAMGSSVISVGNYVFSKCIALTNVTIGESVTSIGDNAFAQCGNLTGLTIGGSVKSIGSNAFSNCAKLQSMIIPRSVTDIGGYAFSGCGALTSIKIPSSVITMGQSVFSGCTALQTINCEAASKPYGWNEKWNNYCEATVRWSA